MNEVILIPTYKRIPFLIRVIEQIRQFDKETGIVVFPDRGSSHTADYAFVADYFKREAVTILYVPAHDYYGNSYNALEALRWAYNAGFDLVHYIEDDVIVHPDYFAWHRRMHENFEDIFASMAWVFNRHTPLVEAELFQPWYYAIGTCFPRRSLQMLMPHCCPLYYQDMPGYIAKVFADSKMNTPFGIEHFEQDGLIQRVIDRAKVQTVSAGLAKCTHLGAFGYNRGWDYEEELFEGCDSIVHKLQRINEFFNDEHWRVEMFGRDVVEREVHHEIPEVKHKYRVKLPGGFETEFESGVRLRRVPSKINSVPMPRDAELVLVS